MTIALVEDMIRLFPISPKKMAFTLDEPTYQLMVADLSLSVPTKEWTGKDRLDFNLGTTKVTIVKQV